jgi:hypothetical protein
MTDKLAKPGQRDTDLASVFGTQEDLTQRPDFIPAGDKSGTEGITADDIRLPRLLFAQGLSAQMTPGNALYMEDLKNFQMFNDDTREIYGMGPIYFVVCRRDVKRIEFIPREEGSGIRDMNVPLRDPRLEWTKDEDGVRVPPRATVFNNYVILILKAGGNVDPVVLSINNRNKFNQRATTDLNGSIKKYASQGERSVPIYGAIYSIASKPETNSNGTFATPVIRPVGYIPKSMPDLFRRAQEYAASLEGKDIEMTQREPGSDDFVDAEPAGVAEM